MLDKISGICVQMDLLATKFSAEISDVRADLTSKIDHLNTETSKHFDVITASVADTNNELMRLKRWSELLLLGLPFVNNEDLGSVFTLICATINYGSPSTQCSIFRLGKSTVHDNPATILIHFVDQISAMEFMSSKAGSTQLILVFQCPGASMSGIIYHHCAIKSIQNV